MRFLIRAFTGLVLAAVAIAFLGLGAKRLMTAREDAASKPSRPPAERSYAVEAGELVKSRVAPEISLFGEILSWRSLELRAPAGGAIAVLAENFRDGESVAADALLLRIDPGDANTRVAEADVSLSQALVDQSESRSAVDLVQVEIRSGERQVELRRRELERQKQLFAKGLVSRVVVETAELALSGAEQALTGREQQLLTARMRVDNAVLSVKRARIGVADSGNDLSETSLVAPFAGRLAEVTATAGRRVNVNEKLGLLIDPRALEVRFTVRDELFGRLVTPQGTLAPLEVRVTQDFGGRTEVLIGSLDRDAATVSANDGGRTVYARLENTSGSLIRPGDFVQVTIVEPALEEVARLPASAVSSDGKIFLIGDDGRLEEATVTVARRLQDDVLATDVPWGRRFVAVRLPQLGNGIKVKPRGDEAEQPEMITLTDERRVALIEAVKSNRRMPENVQQNILNKLDRKEVPAEMVNRLERRMDKGISGKNAESADGKAAIVSGAKSVAANESITLDPNRRKKLLDFVGANESMPAERREKMLKLLAAERVDKSVVDRIESRMGD